MERRVFAIVLIIIILLFGSTCYIFAFTSVNNKFMDMLGSLDPTPTPTPTPEPTPTPTPEPTPTPFPTPTPTPRGMMPQSQASAIYMVDGNTNAVLSNVNGNKVLPMASTAKIMTAILTIEDVNLDTKITISQDAVDRTADGTSSTAQLHLGDVIKVRDLLYGALLPSGADAATALADYVGGSTPNFVAMMNNKATRLGLTQTHFVDPDGLTISGDVSMTSAADLTKLAEYAMANSTFASIVAQASYSLAPTMYHRKYDWSNTNGLLSTYPGMLGVKTGHSSIAGYCLAFAAARDGHYIVGAILNSSDEAQRNTDVSNLLDWGFLKLSGKL
ncbi:D-alanyl-D-alanine carboxypeptidase family protein [Dictyobacter formicarum]|uniref:Peptidase S11 D-alanyl-D-alanine carboxypeptidase A N-terminal domain-containing protein n=1 Tax=Dictyobacter formicarum TaxID=2778368 RepID=A0ABQ3VE28_9CHLR|nr:serine hydrolase [Dictyobacter formicarum]GHO83643.1 hypothetical protein KSZ_16490 [Dictyobacter formicarum]